MINIKSEGKLFEQDFKNSIPKDIYLLRLVDPPSSWGDNTNLRFSVHNPYDFLLYSVPNLFPMELKSTKGKSFSFKGTSPMIKKHQIEGLTEANKYDGVKAGFIFNFREPTQRTYFLHINNFNKFVEQTTKSSINEKDIQEYGAVLIEGNQKKVRWTWNIQELISKLKGNV